MVKRSQPQMKICKVEGCGRREEVVHHKQVREGGSGNKADNRIENLVLFASQSEHLRHHEMLKKGW